MSRRHATRRRGPSGEKLASELTCKQAADLFCKHADEFISEVSRAWIAMRIAVSLVRWNQGKPFNIVHVGLARRQGCRRVSALNCALCVSPANRQEIIYA